MRWRDFVLEVLYCSHCPEKGCHCLKKSWNKYDYCAYAVPTLRIGRSVARLTAYFAFLYCSQPSRLSVFFPRSDWFWVFLSLASPWFRTDAGFCLHSALLCYWPLCCLPRWLLHFSWLMIECRIPREFLSAIPRYSGISYAYLRG